VVADLDALLTGLYVLADDLLPRRTGPGVQPTMSDAEPVTLALAEVFLDCPNERRFLRLARRRLGHLLALHPEAGRLHQAPARLGAAVVRLLNCLAYVSPSFCDRLRLLDSTPVPCGQSRRRSTAQSSPATPPTASAPSWQKYHAGQAHKAPHTRPPAYTTPLLAHLTGPAPRRKRDLSVRSGPSGESGARAEQVDVPEGDAVLGRALQARDA
jgi:hypothetical protein